VALRDRGRARGLSEEDVLATAVALTAQAVADALRRFIAPLGLDAVYVSGGGVRNLTLMRALVERLAPIPVSTVDDLGVPASGKEALAFAFLAHQTLGGLPGNVPGATGAARPVVLGHVTPGPA
jgi:anhydro-N-acetylmuramic acid kinase